MNGLVIICQAEGETAVLVAGDPERAHMRKVEEDGGIYYHVNLVEAMVSYDANCERSVINSSLLMFVPRLTTFSEQ